MTRMYLLKVHRGLPRLNLKNYSFIKSMLSCLQLPGKTTSARYMGSINSVRFTLMISQVQKSYEISLCTLARQQSCYGSLTCIFSPPVVHLLENFVKFSTLLGQYVLISRWALTVYIFNNNLFFGESCQ